METFFLYLGMAAQILALGAIALGFTLALYHKK